MVLILPEDLPGTFPPFYFNKVRLRVFSPSAKASQEGGWVRFPRRLCSSAEAPSLLSLRTASKKMLDPQGEVKSLVPADCFYKTLVMYLCF